MPERPIEPPSDSLDDPRAVVYALREMAHAGRQAHAAASEEGGKTGWVRDLIFGLNTAIDALEERIAEGVDYE